MTENTSSDTSSLATQATSSSGRKYLLEYEDLSIRRSFGDLPLHALLFHYGNPLDSFTYPGFNKQRMKLSDRTVWIILFGMDEVDGYTPKELNELFPEDFGIDGLPFDERQSDDPGETHIIKVRGKDYYLPGLPFEGRLAKPILHEKLDSYRPFSCCTDERGFYYPPIQYIGRLGHVLTKLKQAIDSSRQSKLNSISKDAEIKTLLKDARASQADLMLERSQKKRKREELERDLDMEKANLVQRTQEIEDEHQEWEQAKKEYETEFQLRREGIDRESEALDQKRKDFRSREADIDRLEREVRQKRMDLLLDLWSLGNEIDQRIAILRKELQSLEENVGIKNAELEEKEKNLTLKEQEIRRNTAALDKRSKVLAGQGRALKRDATDAARARAMIEKKSAVLAEKESAVEKSRAEMENTLKECEALVREVEEFVGRPSLPGTKELMQENDDLRAKNDILARTNEVYLSHLVWIDEEKERTSAAMQEARKKFFTNVSLATGSNELEQYEHAVGEYKRQWGDFRSIWKGQSMAPPGALNP